MLLTADSSFQCPWVLLFKVTYYIQKSFQLGRVARDCGGSTQEGVTKDSELKANLYNTAKASCLKEKKKRIKEKQYVQV